jgi:hypothetical protein
MPSPLGHVPGTALPGHIGNFAVAAHRVTLLAWERPERRFLVGLGVMGLRVR